jgi:hypothetical protein
MPASPCRYPTPLPKYGEVKPCKNGIKEPCAVVPECWAKAGGDVVKSMQCQQEYVRDLAIHLFKTDKIFRNIWLSYVKSYDIPDLERRASSKNGAQNLADRKANYNKGANVGVDNFVTKYALGQLDMYIVGDKIRSLNGIKSFRDNLVTLMKKVFGGLFTFKDGKIDYQTPADGKVCSDIAPYFTFIYNVNLLLTEGTKTHGGRKTRRSTVRRSSTRRSSSRRN